MDRISTFSKCGWWVAVLLGFILCAGGLQALREVLNQSLLWYMVAPGIWGILFIFVGTVLSRKLLRRDGGHARYGLGFLVAGILVLAVACLTIWTLTVSGTTGRGL